ncbi:M15 family metallopeptidase [Sedimentitalea nanhaiensis]|uniref:D-alanyl-D-alanine carboxypeptidase n=1 Tax=Sedimentitalea nanhaiensis TaxID=999627 RepID=A0A1I7D902_9RHOB|nr:M15 family metallopeptidase [Sedimentitalea nanhaiensis]SFU08085.1 D-alanyl-D-alanine carboxypeptidase [Sedimentitalea nanhaiensis]
MRLLPAILIAVAVVLAPAIWVGLTYFLSEEDFQGSAVDSGARIEIEMLRQQVEDLQDRLKSMESELAQVAAGRGRTAMVPTNPDDEDAIFRNSGPNDIIDAYAQVVLIANRTEVNRGLQVARPSYLEEKLGRPRETLSDDCEPMTNQTLSSKLVLEDVGPIRVNMLRPAAESLRRVFENVRRADPDLYARINTSGSLCVRRIRGTANSLSTHSYGLALDLNIDGHLDNFTDGKTQLGLTILADFFREEGWVWGAGFRREDSMHFEISRRQLDEWLAQGML